jgi:hypothetical protein
MPIDEFIHKIKNQPDTISFDETMTQITNHYNYTPVRFRNGVENNLVVNEAGTNEGSCKIFAFAQLNGLNERETLACFGKYYREDVLENPEGTDHGNIRTFIKYGWRGIVFNGDALSKKIGGDA